MHHRRRLSSLLLVLLLFMQYATLAHSTEHHLFGSGDHCAECTLHQQFGQAGSATIIAPALLLAAESYSCFYAARAISFYLQAFHSRAPPVCSLN